MDNEIHGEDNMKIRIIVNPDLTENEVTIQCNKVDTQIAKIQSAISAICASNEQLVFYKGDTEYYLSLDKILFFETSDNQLFAHTKKEMYQTKYRLYELETLLPDNFLRVSKSTILNVNHIFSITRNLTASSEVQFEGTHKMVYVSRNYYKQLKVKLEEKRSLR